MKIWNNLKWTVEELCNQARNEKRWEKAEAFGKVLDEMNDFEKQYKEDEE